MSTITNKQLVKLLREVARRYDENPGSNLFESGICYAVGEAADPELGYRYFEARRAVSGLIREVTDKWEYSVWLIFPGDLSWTETWPWRATFCLLLAHWLEDQT